MYEEINELYRYCLDKNIDANIEPLYDGAKISFPNGGDFVQHYGSYGSNHGCVEPAIGCKHDYTAVSLAQAKKNLSDGTRASLTGGQRNDPETIC